MSVTAGLASTLYGMLERVHPFSKGCSSCHHRIRPLASRLEGLPEPDFPVDVVITWVNGADPVHRAKCEKFHNQFCPRKKLEIGRFRNNGELYFVLRSLEFFAPWVRAIHLVTDEQHPEWLDLKHPKLHLVDHTEFIPADCLPTFNSNVIEAFLHRLPGLAEHYIYFNDDVFLGRPVKKSEFFTPNGLIYCFMDWRSLRYLGYGYSRTEHASSYFNCLQLLKSRGVLTRKDKGFICAHGPYAQTKTNAAQVFAFYEDDIMRFIYNRFRSHSDISFYCHAAPLLLFAQKKLIPCDERYFYIQNRQIDRKIYYNALLQSKIQEDAPFFFCINDSGYKALRSSQLEDMRHILTRYFPQASSFELMPQE